MQLRPRLTNQLLISIEFFPNPATSDASNPSLMPTCSVLIITRASLSRFNCIALYKPSSLICNGNMVGAAAITETNDAYARGQHSGLVCVFAGATAGIGRATLERLATMLHSSTFYILGRNKERHSPWLDQLRAICPSSRFVYIEAQVSLIADIDKACNQILSAERKVNVLCMSPGGMPFAGAKCMLPNRSPLSYTN